MFTLTHTTIWSTLCLFAAFGAGWQSATWHNASVKLALDELATTVKRDIEQSHATAAEQLEHKLQELKANERHFEATIQTEIIKPVFKNVCVSDEFVRLYNAVAERVEHSLSGKHDSTLFSKSTALKK